MHFSIWGKTAVVAATLLMTGCTYVKGFYGGKNVDSVALVQQTAVTKDTGTAFFPQAQRFYTADISAARVYLSTQRPVNQRMVIIDVRDATEYRLGHPEGARHLPYPRVYQACEAHPFGAQQAQLRSDDGSLCRYGVVKDSVVTVSPVDFFQAAQEVLPYQDAPVAVLCRTGACAVEAANLLARPEKMLGATYLGKGYREVYVVQEGFVGEPITAHDASSGRAATLDKKNEKLDLEVGKVAIYGAVTLAQDVNNDGKITMADYNGWRNFLGLPYVVSMHTSLLSELARPYYDKP